MKQPPRRNPSNVDAPDGPAGVPEAAAVLPVDVTWRWACVAAWIAGLLFILLCEYQRWTGPGAPPRTIGGLFVGFQSDSTIFIPLWLIAPILYFRREPAAPPATTHVSLWSRLFGAEHASSLRTVLLAAIVGLTAFAGNVWTGSDFGDLPPAYHDEYSYLLQAETFLSGRLSVPSPPEPTLFDQIHVLNEGRFASRYFPGMGVWLVPFVALGHPVWGMWVAGTAVCVLTFLCGRLIAGDAAGFVAGLLTALSPGMLLFSQLLLAHQPTLLGLMLFLWCYLLLLRQPRWWLALAAGAGLSFAMLCRPMTAAGFAFPMGVSLVFQLIRGCSRKSSTSDNGSPDAERSFAAQSFARKLTCCALLGLPLIAGFVSLGFYNRAITGEFRTSPYQLYTDLYTPRHVYGFYNGDRGDKVQSPRVIKNYDKWADNLTPVLAAQNVFNRLVSSAQWTLGILPLLLALVAGVWTWRQRTLVQWLVLASIVSLHVAHIPYWFMGIMGWHYVFETGPLWLLWFAIVGQDALRVWQQEGRLRMPVWGACLLLASGLMTFTSIDVVWTGRLSLGINNIQYPRELYAQFRKEVESVSPGDRVLVLVRDDPDDVAMSYVTNGPDFDRQRGLVGHYLPETVPVARVQQLYPDRRLFLFDPKSRAWFRL